MDPNFPIVNLDKALKHVDLFKNIDADRLTPALSRAQLEYVKPILGVDFYEQLVLQSFNETFSADNLKLVDYYIAPFVANHMAANASRTLPELRGAVGVMQPNGLNQSPSPTPPAYNAQEFLNAANVFNRELISFLTKNHTLYPLWPKPSGCGTTGGDSGSSANIFIYHRYRNR